MKNFLRVLLAILIIAVIGVAIWTLKIYMEDKKQVNSEESLKTENNSLVDDNKVDDEKEDTIIDSENEVEEQENIEIEPEPESQPEENVNEETSLSYEDKAIELAKKEYGSTDGVYFRIDQIQNNNVYVVSVRDEKTTAALMWYTVDTKNETVK